MKPLSHQLLDRVQAKGPGTVFGNKDFLDLGNRPAVDQALSRLTRRGTIRRLGQGIYDYPRDNPRFGILTPSIDDVASMVAKRNGSRLLASGAYAANLIGLSTQVPAKIVYFTDGGDSHVQIGNQTIEFRHAGPQRMAGAGKISGLVIQALRYLGKGNIDDVTISKVRSKLTDDDRAIIRQDISSAPDWLRPILTQIAGEA